MIHQLPIEILIHIGSFLDSKSYQSLIKLRLGLPTTQTVQFQVFQTHLQSLTISNYRTKRTLLKQFRLDLTFISLPMVVYLIVNDIRAEFKRVVRIVSTDILLHAFVIATSHYFPKLVDQVQYSTTLLTNVEMMSTGQPKKQILGYAFHKSRASYSFMSNLPIKIFSALGHTKLVSRLLKSPDVDPTVDNCYPLLEATKRNHERIVEMLLEDGRFTNAILCECFHIVCEKGYLGILHRFLDMYDPSQMHSYGLILAITNSNIEIVRALLKDGRVDVSVEHQKPLRLAILSRSTVLVEILSLENGVDLHTQAEYCLRHACRLGSLPLVQLLLDRGCDPSVRDNQPLVWAYEAQHWEIVHLLIHHPRIDKSKFVNLLLDPQYDCPEYVLQSVLQYVDPSTEEQFAIRYAVEEQWLTLVKVLLQDKRVSVHVAPKGEPTAYELAKVSNDADIQLLLFNHALK